MSAGNDQYFSRYADPRRARRARIWVLLGVSVLAVLFQVYVPLYLRVLSFLQMPLLVTMYFSLMYRSPVRGIFIGAGIGLTQDSLSQLPLGMLGIVKTLVGYFAGSVGMRFDVDHPVMRFTLTLFFVLFHQLLFWMLQRSLLGATAAFEPVGTLFQALLNAIIGIPLFHLLDKLRSRA